MNLIGFVNALLTNISTIAGMNDPQTKITPVGFLKMLLENNAMAQINNLPELQAGKARDVKLRYMQRGTEADVSDVDDCETPISPEWKETSIPEKQFSKIGIFISDEQMRKYEMEADQTIAQGTPSAPLMRGLYETLLVKVQGLLQKMDTNLITAMNTKWGKNIAYGNTTANPIAFGTITGMNDGYVKLLYDMQENEIADNLLICGNGKIAEYDLYQRLKTGVDARGIGALPLQAYYDPKTTTIWGKDHFGVFAKGMVGLVQWNKNVGAYAGQRGSSIFFTIPLPVKIGDSIVPITFDAQLKYVDCPTFDSKNQMTQNRGWMLLVSANYALFTTPTDVFAAGDRLNGMNGAFHYVATEATNPVTITPASGAVFNTKEQA